MTAMEKFALTLVVLITDVLSLLLFRGNLEEGGYATHNDSDNNGYYHYNSIALENTDSAFSYSNSIAAARNLFLLISSTRRSTNNANKRSWTSRAGLIGFVDAKGVAGMGKVGGESQGGADKAGQQVPPEVYNALTYAGSAFLLTLSVPLILYGLNKVLNQVEECFGCGPSTKERARQTNSSGDNNDNGNGSKPTNPMMPGSAESIGAPFTISHSQPQQQFRNQYQFYDQQQPHLHRAKQQLHHQLQQQSPTISTSHENVAQLDHNHHYPHHPHNSYDQRQQQQQSSSSSPQITSAQLSAGALAMSAPATTTMPSSTAITLPFDGELNYKASTMARHFQQQPYIISSLQI